MEECDETLVEWHHVIKLSCMKNSFNKIFVVIRKGRQVTGTESFHVAFNRKQIPPL